MDGAPPAQLDPHPVPLIDRLRLAHRTQEVPGEGPVGEPGKEGAAVLRGSLGQPVAGHLAGIEGGDESGEPRPGGTGGGEGRHDGQHRVPGRQGGEGPAAEGHVGTQEEPAIRLEPDHGRGPVAPGLVHAGDDEGRTDPGADHPAEAAGGFQGRSGGDGHDHRVRPEEAGGDEAEDVTAHDPPGAVRHEGPVGVAVGGDEGIVGPRGHDLADIGDVLRAVRLGVDGHEPVRPADRLGLGAEAGEEVGEEVPGDAALLVDRDAQAREAIRREGVAVAAAVAGDGVGLRRGRRGRGHLATGADIPQRREDRGLVRFGDLAVRPVELQAVAVLRDMASRDHDGVGPAPHRLQGERRGRQGPAIDRREPGRGGGGGHRRRDAGAAVAQVPADHHLPAPAAGRHGPEERPRIGIARPADEFSHETAQAACSEFKTVHGVPLDVDRAMCTAG